MRRLRIHWLVLLFVLVALVLTYPVALRLVDGTALPGLQDFDEFEYTWLLWWYQVSLVDRQSAPNQLPFYYPMQTTQPLVDVTPLGWLLAVPLVMCLGAVRAYSAFWLLNFVLCAFTAYLLAYWLTRLRAAALIAGLIFAFYPGKMLHGLGHMGDMLIFMFPLYALFLLRFVDRPCRRNAALLAAVTTIGLLIDFRHIALFYLPFTAIFLVYQAVVAPRRLFSRRVVVPGLLATAAVFGLTLPFFGPFLLSSLGGQLGHLKEGGLEASSADLLSFVLPPLTHPLFGRIPALQALMQAVWTENIYIETCLYLGVVAVTLAVIALARRMWRAWFWAAVIAVCALFALGPVLTVAGRPLAGVRLPYAWLHRLPFYEWVRIPGRMDMTIKLALAMLAALGAAALLRRLSSHRRAALAAVLSALLLFEYLTFVPYPTAEVQPSPFLAGLSGDGEEYGILTFTSHEYAMYLQTLHGHPMVEGHIHRWPPGGSEWALQLHGLAVYPPQSARAYWDILDDRLPYGRDGGDVFAGHLDVSPNGIFAQLGIRYVVFDRRLGWDSADKSLYRARLRAYFGAPVDEDGRFTVHEVHAGTVSGPQLTPDGGWYPLEGDEHELWRWMGADAAVRVTGAPPGDYRLLLAVRPFAPTTQLTVSVGDAVVAEYTIAGRREIITPAFPLDGTATTLAFSLAEGCTPAFDPLRGVLDERCLGLAFGAVRLFPHLAKPYRFGERIALEGYERTVGVGDDRALYVSLYWQALDRMDRDYTVFVHVLDGSGRTIAQDDRLLVNRQGVPSASWNGDEGVRSLQRIALPAGIAPEAVRLKIGVYDVTTLERLALPGDASGENVVILP